MTPGRLIDSSWIWHPYFSEERRDTAGLFVHFRQTVHVSGKLPASLPIHITADTRYKLYVNNTFVSFGPVKGDQHLWFFDEAEIAPFLRPGSNTINIVVLRYFYSTSYAPSFPRLPTGGLRITSAEPHCIFAHWFQNAESWETAIEPGRILRIDEPEDDFLHIYEQLETCSAESQSWQWFPAVALEMPVSTGNSTPWHLSPRMIPRSIGHHVNFEAVHNVSSSLPSSCWEQLLAPSDQSTLKTDRPGLRLPASSLHRIDLEATEHLTAFIRLRFQRPSAGGSKICITYAESYEDEPRMVPYLRCKQYRQDTTKSLYGPQDIYELQGPLTDDAPTYHDNALEEEVIIPFHWRTFRFIRLEIQVAPMDLVLLGIDITTNNYPLDVKAEVSARDSDLPERLMSTSLRTLRNCIHDCYEDCPFYEQLQYAMDTRSSALFTYYAAGDDRVARQAIHQIHNSYRPSIGLTCSRAPSHRPQVIPHFSLYWIMMLDDHLTFFDDRPFIKQFLPVVDAVLAYFDSRLHPELGLTVSDMGPGVWNFVDWAEEWRPYGISPAAEETGISTYTNALYAYTLRRAARVQDALSRSSLAREYNERAERITHAVRTSCFDGEAFTDSVASEKGGYSQQSQIWAVLCGAVAGAEAQELLRRCLRRDAGFVKASVSMSFYTLRALGVAGGDVYDQCFHEFWEPWVRQLELGVTTWEEDSVSQRSDCHAWGSAPIYEYMAEVAGVQPAMDGWSEVLFRPRLGLFANFTATVPLGAPGGKLRGVAKVAWDRDSLTGVTVATLAFEMEEEAEVVVRVHFQGGETQRVNSGSKLTFSVYPDGSIQ